MRVRRVGVAGIAVIGLLMGVPGVSATTSSAAGAGSEQIEGVVVHSAEETGFEWTAGAMAAAAAPESPNLLNKGGEGSGRASEDSVPEVLSEPVVPGSDVSAYADVVPLVGRLYYTYDGRPETCSAASVTTGSNSSVLTAAHCLYRGGIYSKNMVYVPGKSGDWEPFGRWSFSTFLVLDQWVTHQNSLANQAVLNVKPRSDGKSLTDVVGSYGLTIGRGAVQQNVSVLGYPVTAAEKDTAIRTCKGTTYSASRAGYAAMNDCVHDGASAGGPWVKDGYIFAVHTSHADRVSMGTILNEHTRSLFAHLQLPELNPGIYRISPQASPTSALAFSTANRVVVETNGDRAAQQWRTYTDENRSALLFTNSLYERQSLSSDGLPHARPFADLDTQYWVATTVDPSHGGGYVLASYDNPTQVLQYTCDYGCDVTVAEYDPGNVKQLWTLSRKAALDEDPSNDGRTVTIRPNNHRTLAFDASGSLVLLRAAGDYTRESWQIARVGPAFTFRNVLTGDYLSSYDGDIQARNDGREIHWELRPGPIGTYYLAPFSRAGSVVALEPVDRSRLILAEEGHTFDLTDVGGPLTRLGYYQISPIHNPDLVASVPGHLGAEVQLRKPGWATESFTAHWIMEKGAYVFEGAQGHNIAWDSSKGQRVISWDGSYTDQHWIPRQTPEGTLLVNMKDPDVVLEYGTTGANEGTPLIARNYYGSDAQLWTLTKTTTP